MVETRSWTSDTEYLVSLIKELPKLNRAIIGGLANGSDHGDLLRKLGISEARFLWERENIAQTMGEFRTRDGLRKAIAISVLEGLITPKPDSRRHNFDLSPQDLRLLALMGKGASSYKVASEFKIPLDSADARINRVSVQIGAKTIYRATALAALALREAHDRNQTKI